MGSILYADCTGSCSNSSGCCGIESTSSSSCSNFDNVYCQPKILPFSQGENRARDYAAVTQFQYLPEKDDINWHVDLAIEYQQNFQRGKLGAYFFPNGTNQITVGPSDTPGVDVRNVDIGLSDTFLGALRIKPSIQNVIIEPQMYLGLDRWIEGAWLWFKVPITHTRWSLDCCETDSQPGGQFFSSIMTNTAVNGPVLCPASGLTNQIESALSGALTWGDMHTKLNAARFICCPSDKTGVADLPIHLGYNFVTKERGYGGIYARVVFPTGSEKNLQSVFNPRVGYKRWQLGAGIDGGVRIFERNEDTTINAIFDVFVTHIFKKTECRVFDLRANGCFSRYLLMKETDVNGNYTGNLVNFVDIFTTCVQSKFNWNVDGLIFFEFLHRGWTIDLGYEIKARAKEEFENCAILTTCNPCNEHACSDDCCTTAATRLGNKQYGIKGNTGVDGIGNPITTESGATINTYAPVDPAPVLINGVNFGPQLDFVAAQIPRAVSNKVWAHFGYAWQDRDYPVYAGLGTEVEFGSDNKALHLWGIWAKGGVAYN